MTFDIDANGIVHVSAKDRATSKEQSITITGQSSLDDKDIEQMVKDAEAHAEEDSARREAAEARNNADSLIYQTEKVIKDQGDSLSEDDTAPVESALTDLKAALEGDDGDAIKSGTEALATASQAMSQKMYENAAAQDNAEGGEAGVADDDDDDVVDAEIVDEDQ